MFPTMNPDLQNTKMIKNYCSTLDTKEHFKIQKHHTVVFRFRRLSISLQAMCVCIMNAFNFQILSLRQIMVVIDRNCVFTVSPLLPEFLYYETKNHIKVKKGTDTKLTDKNAKKKYWNHYIRKSDASFLIQILRKCYTHNNKNNVVSKS